MTSIIDDEYFTEIENGSNMTTKKDVEDNYLIRCSSCYEEAILKFADFKNNKFVTECDNFHENTYDSYDSFIENTFKNLNNILCHNCKKCNDSENELYRCNECFFFLCDKCKSLHEKEVNHSSFVSLNAMDSKIYINKEMPELNEIKEECSMIDKNLTKIQNIEKYFDLFLKEFINFKNNFIQALNNYFLTQKKITNYLKNNFNKNNEKTFTNYETFHNNNDSINNYIERVNNYFNTSFIEKGDIESNTKMFINIIQKFKSNNHFSIKKEEFTKKINEMEKLDLGSQEEVTSFTSINNGQNIIFGLKKGVIKIYNFKINISNTESFNLRLKIEEFKNEIKHLCELDKELFAASDEKNNIKIIEYKDNIPKYTLIQYIENDDYNNKIYSMINLPILSQKNNKYYFCTSNNEHISIYSMDKPFKNKKNKFSLMKNIRTNTQIHCMIEVEGNYLVASCSQAKSIKFFDINNEFEEKSEITKIKPMAGNNIMALIPNRNMLIVGCADGFNIISTQNLKKYRFVHCKYKVLSLDMANDAQVICCSKYEGKINIKQYKINEDDFTFEKITERNIDDGQEIWKLKVINKKVFYLKSNYEINGLA